MNIESINRSEIKVLLLAAQGAVKELTLMDQQAKRGCRTCTQFTEGTSFCTVAKAPVPPEYVSQGCDEWKYDTIPF